MPCPTPIHSPALINNQPKLSPKEGTRFSFESLQEDKARIPKPETNTEMNSSNAKNTSAVLQTNGKRAFSKITTIISPASPLAASWNNFNPSLLRSSKPEMTKITRQSIRDLPMIPKFNKKSSFPLVCEVRQISSTSINIPVPKMMSLELFNPETDDLDSDSSEPSSPDSIDSVINALQAQISAAEEISVDGKTNETDEQIEAQETISKNYSTSSNLLMYSKTSSEETEKSDDRIVEGQVTSNSFNDNDLDKEKNIIINQNDINLNTNSIYQHHVPNIDVKTNHNSDEAVNLEERRNHLVDFAEQLSAQLLKNLDETKKQNEFLNYVTDDRRDSEDLLDLNGDVRSFSELRDELRERRLMLANLSTRQQIPQVEESRLQSSFTPQLSIEELEEDESPPLSAKIQSHLSQNPNLMTSLGTPQATKKQQKINDFIPEENEENDEDESSKADEDSSLRSRISFSHLSYIASNNNFNNTHDTALLLREDSFDEADNSSSVGLQQMKQNLLKNIKHPNKLSDSNNNSNTNSCESWANSNSTTASLDSPSVGGGSATHHRYYHVFREGELDSLINKHIGNLHIVSSYYERASW